MQIEYKYMSEEDLPAIGQMASEEGWLSDIVEFQTFLGINPFGCFVCVKGDKVIGSIMTFLHAKSAWIGNFIVSKEYRGRGIGKKLLTQVIKYLDKKKKKQIYLNADYKTRKLYKKFDFEEVIPINRWNGELTKSADNMENLQEVIPDILRFVKLDAFLWKDERFSLISQLSSLRHSRSYSEPFGFLMYGKIGDIVSIGPWELKDGNEDVAEKLFISALVGAKSESKIFLDVPSINKKAKKILTKYNFKIVDSTMFMCRGKLPKIRFNEIFSFATMGSMG